MSGEQILITLETASGAPSAFPVVLKKVMEMPPPNILDGDDGKSRTFAAEQQEVSESVKTRV